MKRERKPSNLLHVQTYLYSFVSYYMFGIPNTGHPSINLPYLAIFCLTIISYYLFIDLELCDVYDCNYMIPIYNEIYNESLYNYDNK